MDFDIAPPIADALAEPMDQHLDGVLSDFFADRVDGVLERFLRYDKDVGVYHKNFNWLPRHHG